VSLVRHTSGLPEALHDCNRAAGDDRDNAAGRNALRFAPAGLPSSVFDRGTFMARRPNDPRDAAEAAFKKATTKPADLPPTAPSLPGVKEMVSLRIDRDVLDYFQEEGPGWQERINAALRKAAGK
jgi:uncharacterized protein (DUF4415 family)